MIGLHGLRNDGERFAGQAHEVKRDAFPRCPADRFACERGTVTGEDDCTQAVDAWRVKGLGSVWAAHTQRAPPDLQCDAVLAQEKQVFHHGLTITQIRVIEKNGATNV
jgi:hypothetical protein